MFPLLRGINPAYYFLQPNAALLKTSLFGRKFPSKLRDLSTLSTVLSTDPG